MTSDDEGFLCTPKSSRNSGVGANVVAQGVLLSAAPAVVVVVVVVAVMLEHVVLVLLKESVLLGTEICASALVTVV